MATKAEKRKYYELWQRYRENSLRNTPIDLFESQRAKKQRIARLESHPEEWFKYYFPEFYTADPAPFHIAATKRVLKHPEWFEVRSWSRELAKTARTMMEVLYLTLTGRKHNVLMVSNNKDNAERLLLPYKSILEVNNRIINDYGKQENIGHWEADEFITRTGVAFRAIGAGQSPRGTRNNAMRPDVIIIDDIDTDEEVRNPDRIKEKVKWVMGALYGTRSISNPLLLIANGNIIARYCTITELGKVADKWDIVNIRDKNGKSTWPAKNTEEMINRVLSKIPWSTAQREYFNNPVVEGEVFRELHFGKVPPPSACSKIIAYADPSTTNKTSKQASYKSVVIVGEKNGIYYVYKVWLEQTGIDHFVDWLFEAYRWMRAHKVDTPRIFIENNSLQNPFYEQVILPKIKEKNRQYGIVLPISEDDRKKRHKYDRVEATLEPLNRLGHLIFDRRQQTDPHMQRLHDQMLSVSPSSKIMDGPDALEGGVWILQNKWKSQLTYLVGNRPNRKY